ncbi:MAG: RAMP superfamily CRISPR-associated protein [Candidatus Helarchaeota archaeon]
MRDIFQSYNLITNVYGKIITKSAVRIGIGREHSIVESYLPIIKSIDEKPIIPGSTLKGLTRSCLTRILLINSDKYNNLIDELFGHSNLENDGKDIHASAIFFYDIVSNSYNIINKVHIRINKESQSVENLFNVDCVSEDSIFEGRLFTTRNIPLEFISIAHLIKNLSEEGILRLGGFKSRGYGLFKVQIDKIDILFVGKSIKDLENGITINFNIPNENHKYFFKIEKTVDKSKLLIKNLNSENSKNYLTVEDVKIEEFFEIFGSKISLENKKVINDFLEDSLNLLNHNLESFL